MRKSKFNEMKVGKKLSNAFLFTAVMSSIAAIFALVALVIVGVQYSEALKNYGFAQGDIGKALVSFADVRSNTRGALGFNDTATVDELMKSHEETKEQFLDYWKTVENAVVTADEKKVYKDTTDKINAYWDIDQNVLEMGKDPNSMDRGRAQAQAMDDMKPAYDAIYSNMVKLMEMKVSYGKQLENKLKIVLIVFLILIVAIIAITMVVSQKIGRGIASGIANPLAALGERLKTFAKGDLTSKFPEHNGNDEIAEMIHTAEEMAGDLKIIINDASYVLEGMAEGDYTTTSKHHDGYEGEFSDLLKAMQGLKRQMNETLGQVTDSARQVTFGSENLAQSAQALAEGATNQAAAVQELQATFAEVAGGIEKTAEKVENSYEIANTYAKKADESRSDMLAMVDAMKRITETSQKIGNIISDIEDIASQTNLLSLNASIEAARAGDAGAGFAVVADQIRRLAEQCAQSAVDTRELIEASLSEVEEGNQAAENVAKAIENIVDGIEHVAVNSKELSEISKQQADTISQTEKGIGQISEVVQTNSATAEETSATSQELSAQSVSMNELASKFKLKQKN